ncbi:hypothetical protein [Vibrio parahaemolyticus]|nr:hypothetical protein [Vibrio parahaemolyticus]
MISGENSAKALLERIKAERKALAGKKKSVKKRKRKGNNVSMFV